MHPVLRKDLRDHLTTKSAWPKGTSYVRYCRGGPQRKPGMKQRRESDRPISNDVFGKMKKGDPVDRRHIEAFAGYFLAGCDDNDNKKYPRFREALTEYLIRHGVDADELDCQKLADILLETPHDDPLAKEADGAQEDLKAFLDSEYARECHDSWVPKVVNWIMLEAGRAYAPPGARLSEDELLAAAEKAGGISTDRFAEIVRSWSRTQSTTVALAMAKRRPVGVTIVLPVNDIAYEDFYYGRRPWHDIPSEAILPRSNNLIIVALAQHPHPDADNIKPATALRLAILKHVAVSARPLFATRSRLRAVTIAGTPLNEQRLRSVGYKPTGYVMPGCGLKIYERQLDPLIGTGLLKLLAHWIAGIQVFEKSLAPVQFARKNKAHALPRPVSHLQSTSSRADESHEATKKGISAAEPFAKS